MDHSTSDSFCLRAAVTILESPSRRARLIFIDAASWATRRAADAYADSGFDMPGRNFVSASITVFSGSRQTTTARE